MFMLIQCSPLRLLGTKAGFLLDNLLIPFLEALNMDLNGSGGKEASTERDLE